MSHSILIVEDEAFIRALLEETLEDAREETSIPFDTLIAADGQEGLTQAQAHHPALVLLDVMMPKMNGFDVCQAIKNDPHMTHTSVALLTARGQEADRARGLNAGADYYITKPFDPAHIIELVKKHIEECA